MVLSRSQSSRCWFEIIKRASFCEEVEQQGGCCGRVVTARNHHRLYRAVKQNQSDVYIFFAGHGLASDDGEQMYLLPYDGASGSLEKTAMLREELFDGIVSANPVL